MRGNLYAGAKNQLEDSRWHESGDDKWQKSERMDATNRETLNKI